MKTILRLLRPLLAALGLSPLAAAPAAPDGLESGFAQPPPDCRPEVFWDWMGGMISREGITKDLEALAAQGVGGVMIMQMPDWFVNRQPRPSSGRFTFTTWRYYDQAAPLQPSGLLGPVKLLTTSSRSDLR